LLGDALLEYVVAEYYYYRDPSVRINDFRRAKSRKPCNDALGTLCFYFHLHEAIAADDQDTRDGVVTGVAKVHDRMANGVRGWEQMNLPKVLGDTFEAVIGAIFVDAKFELLPVCEGLKRDATLSGLCSSKNPDLKPPVKSLLKPLDLFE
ncbi:Dicer-like protein 1, partial [Mortierella sp. AD010]